jgi:hypothetical protein
MLLVDLTTLIRFFGKFLYLFLISHSEMQLDFLDIQGPAEHENIFFPKFAHEFLCHKLNLLV